MTSRKTIACDKCGHRIDHIPEKCPECGEVIRDRMDPHVRERVEDKLRSTYWSRLKEVGFRPGYLFRILFIGSAVSLLLTLLTGGCYQDGPCTSKSWGFPFPVTVDPCECIAPHDPVTGRQVMGRYTDRSAYVSNFMFYMALTFIFPILMMLIAAFDRTNETESDSMNHTSD